MISDESPSRIINKNQPDLRDEQHGREFHHDNHISNFSVVFIKLQSKEDKTLLGNINVAQDLG